MDLLTTWRAERCSHTAAPPTAVKAFLYPPSSLLLFRPLAALSSHELKVVGLAATVVVAWAGVMLSAEAIGLRWWGITSAVTILLLSFTQAMTGELGLENVTVLCFLALAAFFFLSIPITGSSVVSRSASASRSSPCSSRSSWCSSSPGNRVPRLRPECPSP